MLLVCYEGSHSKRLSFVLQSMGRDMAQPASSEATTSITPPPVEGIIAPSRRGAARGGIKSSGGPNKFYAMRRRQKLEASPNVVTCILTVQSQDVYSFIDPSSTLSYVIPYVAMEFGIESEQLYKLFSVSTLLMRHIICEASLSQLSYLQPLEELISIMISLN